jgi:hypothetical protein
MSQGGHNKGGKGVRKVEQTTSSRLSGGVTRALVADGEDGEATVAEILVAREKGERSMSQ